MNIIEVNNLSFGYGKNSLFSAVSFAIKKGEFVKLTGPNGSGKSTLIKLLIKDLDIQTGSIKLFGENINTFKNWRKLGYLPQKNNGGEFPATVYEIVLTAFYKKRLWPFYTKQDKENAVAALKQTGMEQYAKTQITSLSGGQLQRVLTARLLAASPELLILDEPMTGIDAGTCEYLFTLYRELADSGVTVLMISHDTTKRDGVFDRTLCLAYGNIIEIDKRQVMREIQSMHRHPEN